jgi:hypothetical protein
MSPESLNTDQHIAVRQVETLIRIAAALERIASALEPRAETPLTFYDQVEGIAELLTESSSDGALAGIKAHLGDISDALTADVR